MSSHHARETGPQSCVGVAGASVVVIVAEWAPFAPTNLKHGIHFHRTNESIAIVHGERYRLHT